MFSPPLLESTAFGETHPPRFSIIVPVWREEAQINALIQHIWALDDAQHCEILVVDGHPEATTIATIRDLRVQRFAAPRGRACQMNLGAFQAQGEFLVFLHADTRLPQDALAHIARVLAGDAEVCGAFSLALDASHWVYQGIGYLATLRARLTGVPYGDQVLFVRRTYFRRLQGYRRLPILEDVEFIQRVKHHGGRVCILPEKVRTSVRRLQQEGIVWCLARNLVLIGFYHLGVSPHTLARYYPALRPPPKKETVTDPASLQR